MTDINLSPSCINAYFASPLMFYFRYLLRQAPDTPVIKCYGDAGTLVHYCIEQSLKTNISFDADAFHELWNAKNLDVNLDAKGQVLNWQEYHESYLYALRVLKGLDLHQMLTELEIRFPLLTLGSFSFFAKGIIDLIGTTKDGNIIICDWKTNGNHHNDKDHELQGKHYAYLYYKQYGIIPTTVRFVYVRIREIVAYLYTEQDLITYENYLQRFAYDIASRGLDISKYDYGNCFENMFNEWKQACLTEKKVRESSAHFIIEITERGLKLPAIPQRLAQAIDLKFSYEVPGKEFMGNFKSGSWDGKKHFFTRGFLPYAFLDCLVQLIKDFNTYFKVRYTVEVIDMRNGSKTSLIHQTKFAPNTKELRDYQIVAVCTAIERKIGILNLGTGAGKTVIAAELIRKLNRDTLFLVNRIELVDQTITTFQEELGVAIGRMVEGELDCEKQIIVSTVQTICAILERNDESTKKLKRALENISMVIFDECHGVSKSGQYGDVVKVLPNITYAIGLTGTAWKNDGTTLEMNALVGFPIFKKSTEELEEEGHLTPTKAIFITQPKRATNAMIADAEYAQLYQQTIVQNTERNKQAMILVQRFREKKKILILTRAIAHAKLLGDLIPNSRVIVGETDTEKRKQYFAEFKENRDMVLIGSMKIFGTGIDIPDLDVIINMTAHKSGVDSIQIIGRVKRKSEGKAMSYFIDFDDEDSFFKNAARERKHIIQQFGNQLEIVPNVMEVVIE